MTTARRTMDESEIAQVLAGHMPSVARCVDADGVAWLWAGHVVEQVQGDGTAECEYLMEHGYLDQRSIETCECGCEDARCYVYRVR